MSSLVDIYCDFDGTVTRGDTIDVLLEKLALPSWQAIEERWERGEIGSRQCMALQVPLIQGGWPAVLKVLDSVKVDPTFARFAHWCRQSGITLRIVSDGIDRVIHHILKRENIQVDNVWANHLVEDDDGTLQLTFPHAPRVAGCSSGLCKCQILNAGASRPLKVVIGDGRSDFCWASDADLVYAKSKLLSHCRASGIDCVAYEDFTHVRASLEEKIAAAAAAAYVPVPALRQALI